MAKYSKLLKINFNWYNSILKYYNTEVIHIKEYTLSVNEFNNPKILKDAEAVGTLLVRLLLLEPGTFESHPDMGVGIVSRYRYSFNGRAEELRVEFERQIEKYLPSLKGITINVSEIDNTYYLRAQIDNGLYAISFSDNFNVQYAYKSLTDLGY